MRAGSAVTDLLARYHAAVTGVALAARTKILAALPKAEERVDTSARVIGYGFGPGLDDLFEAALVAWRERSAPAVPKRQGRGL
jgi:hypothetical protein